DAACDRIHNFPLLRAAIQVGVLLQTLRTLGFRLNDKACKLWCFDCNRRPVSTIVLDRTPFVSTHLEAWMRRQFLGAVICVLLSCVAALAQQTTGSITG